MQLQLVAVLAAASVAGASNWCGQFQAPVVTKPCPGGKCDCRASSNHGCPAGTYDVCGQTAIYCCPQQQNPYQQGGMGMGGMGMGGMGMGGMGMGGMGMGGMGAMGGMGMGGMSMPGSMCGGSMMSLLGGTGGGCGGGSMCQPPMFQGMNQQLMMQRQIQMMMQRMMMQQQMQRMMQPRLGMSVRVCTCPPGSFSAMGGMCQPFGGGVQPIGSPCMGGFGGGYGGGCVPNAMCMGGQCQCQPGFMPTGQYCTPLTGLVQPFINKGATSNKNPAGRR